MHFFCDLFETCANNDGNFVVFIILRTINIVLKLNKKINNYVIKVVGHFNNLLYLILENYYVYLTLSAIQM